MQNVLVVFSTQHGQTEKIARRIANGLVRPGISAEVIDAAGAAHRQLDHYDAVIVGAPVYEGKFSREIFHWVRDNAIIIQQMPSGFFSVCLGILEATNEKTQAEEKAIVTRFLEATGWHPAISQIFAGSLAYPKYNWVIRNVMRRIARKVVGATDTRRDHEYTDWDAVDDFARAFARQLIPGSSVAG